MPLVICILIGALLGPVKALQPVATLAGGIFLFLSSFEFNPRELFRDYQVTLKLWLGAFVLPFVCGYALPYLLPSLFPTLLSQQKMALMLGIATAVSAVPVIIKIMQELGWEGSERAKRVLSTAILCDLMAWILFLPLLPRAGQAGWILSHATLFLFFVGLVLALIWPKLTARSHKVEFVNRWIVAPLFFIFIGQKLDFTHGFDFWQIVIVFTVASLSKMIGVWFAARLVNIPKNESFAIALSLNARGAMEIVMASFALQAGLIDSTLFLTLVIMALSTSLLIQPILRIFKIRFPKDLSA